MRAISARGTRNNIFPSMRIGESYAYPARNLDFNLSNEFSLFFFSSFGGIARALCTDGNRRAIVLRLSAVPKRVQPCECKPVRLRRRRRRKTSRDAQTATVRRKRPQVWTCNSRVTRCFVVDDTIVGGRAIRKKTYLSILSSQATR